MKKINSNELIEESINNIRSDREQAQDLLKDLITYVAGGSDRHKESAFAMSKYLEVLQRSNEQLVKIVAISKTKEEDNADLSDDDRNDIFEQLNSAVKVEPKDKKAKK